MNPLREIPLLLMPHLPDTLFGVGVAMAAGVLATGLIAGGLASAAYLICLKMGYVE